MAILRPFNGIRPDKKYVSQVAALPYDVLNRKEAFELTKANPYSFLHVDKAEIDLDPSIDPYDKCVYEKARDNLYKMIEDGIYIKDNEKRLYFYRLIMDGRSQIGIVGCTSIDEYENNIIKKHEYTRADKEQDRINHVDYCNANTGPIFLTYRADNDLDSLVENWIAENEPVYDFTADDDIQHTVWLVDQAETVENIVNIFGGIDNVYIADGHHRTASAVKVGKMRREQNPEYTGDEEFNFFLSVLFPDKQMYIMDYNRVVKDLNNLTEEEFMKKVEEKFIINKKEEAYKPGKTHSFGMYLSGTWYELIAKDGTYDENDPVKKLDVSILQNNLLNPVLGIEDPRKDKRIDFVGGIRGLKELEKRVDEDMVVAFSMYPTSISELMDIADADRVMPPKSTWFEPKLRSGIFVHEL